MTTNSTWFGIGVAQTGLFNAKYVQLADDLLELPTNLADYASSFDELGTLGLGSQWIANLSMGISPQPPQIVVNEVNTEIAVISQAGETLLRVGLNAVTCTPTTTPPDCINQSGTTQAYVPWVIAGPGQHLILLVTGLSASGVKLNSTALGAIQYAVYPYSWVGVLSACPNSTMPVSVFCFASNAL